MASDVPAILHHTRDMFFLADGDLAVITPQGVKVTDFDGKPVERKPQRVTWDPIMAEKGGFKHFMLKEIYEQPRAVRDTTLGRVSLDTGKVFLDEMRSPTTTSATSRELTSPLVERVGTPGWGQVHDGTAGRVPVEVDYASEYRYRDPLVGAEDLTVLITQSGETADTIAAQREAKAKGSKTGHLQRGGIDDCARSRRHDLHACGAGNRRGFDEGIHRAADRAVSARASLGSPRKISPEQA